MCASTYIKLVDVHRSFGVFLGSQPKDSLNRHSFYAGFYGGACVNCLKGSDRFLQDMLSVSPPKKNASTKLESDKLPELIE